MNAKPLYMMGMMRLYPTVSNRPAFHIRAIAWSRTDSEAPLYIEKIEKKEAETVILCTLLGLTQKYVIPFTDDASIENVIHCLTVMLYLKPTSVNDANKFARLEPVAMRLDVKQGIINLYV